MKRRVEKKGNFKNQEIEIVTDTAKIREIEKTQKAKYMKQGMSDAAATAASKVGIVLEDGYWVVLRDAVIFPTGAEGLYGRLLLKKGLDGVPGVVILPVINGKVAAVVAFRHATRSWELEISRGMREKGETPETAVRRELEEETGYTAKEIHYMGDVAIDPGITSAVSPIYIAKVDKEGYSNQDESEAIFGVKTFTVEELKGAFVKGFIEIPIQGRKEKVFVRDAYLLYALSLAEMQKLL